MSFKELQTLPEFIKLDSQRFGVLSCLDALKDAIDGLPTDKPSWRSFSKVEANVEIETSNLNGINKKMLFGIIQKVANMMTQTLWSTERRHQHYCLQLKKHRVLILMCCLVQV